MSQSRSRQSTKKAEATASQPSCTLLSDADINNMSAKELLSAMVERNTDPYMSKLIGGLIRKLPLENNDTVEAEKR
ncbi:unnamed protein product, partial [Nippostrongylus brasiliensis]|uniref:Uncharacterized protein n=1 Tax=Nippostrongylus brasiliensis TaxID=27835 RepID=A0A0N4YI81_NIPBR